ncbi:aspartyl protease family protein [Sphingomonas immobilis]|uniref:Aspartyl protease family protein n=1 Tax=Sphingomonas immobilis TaxID=3063997 RepID=A0ABT8ZWD0_9SPHN|nr:aspartyl protease family protein [Sphingomonas sp. CA1-15]MDO7841444.1 aspartyl protease family protein [Sphingomonas sp. CA1-15]
MEWMLACAAPLLALAAPVPAQEPLAPEAPVTAAELIAFGNEAGRMTVPVQIADAGPYRFIVDTGAERTVIARELASLLRLSAGATIRMTSMADVRRVETVVIPRIGVGPLGGERIEAPALGFRNLGAPGMLGIDALQGHVVTIDFDRQEMTVLPSVKRKHTPIAAPGEIVVRARDVFGQLVVTDASYRERRVRVVIDTGSAVTMGNAALRRLVAGRPRGLQAISLTSVTGSELAADYTQIEQVKIGEATIQNLPVAFAEAPPFARFGLSDRPALMLGMDALRLFRRVKIDFANRELRLLLPREAMRAGALVLASK